MTPLQHLAFERIEILSKESLELIPDKFILNEDHEIIPTKMDVQLMESIKNKLHEQQLWIDALNIEDRSR